MTIITVSILKYHTTVFFFHLHSTQYRQSAAAPKVNKGATEATRRTPVARVASHLGARVSYTQSATAD